MLLLIILFLSLFPVYVRSAIHEELQPIPTPIIEMGVSSMIGSCVNAITGDYVEQANDLVLLGPEPLVFSRMHFSSDYQSRHLWAGWRHSLGSAIIFGRDKEKGTYLLNTLYFDYGGSSGAFKGEYKEKKTAKAYFEYSSGFSNCTSGIISAKTNLKNTVIKHPDFYSDVMHAKLSSGVNAEFKYHEYWGDRFFVTKETSPNGFVKEYLHNDFGSLDEVRLYGGDETVSYSHFKIAFNEHLSPPHIEVEGSDGRKVKYLLTNEFKRCDCEKMRGLIPRRYIKTVQSPETPEVNYEYIERARCPSGALISKRWLPDGRAREITYYDEEHTTDSEDFRLNRVRQIWAPIGHNKELHLQYQFKYDRDDEEHSKYITIYGGKTTVFDPYGHQIVYKYNAWDRLKSIARCKETGKERYSTHSYFWGEEELKGHLVGKAICQGKNVPLSARFLDYDDCGNVIRDATYGQITGKSPALLIAEEKPVANGVESYGINYRYEQKGLFRLQKEEHDNGKKILYSYEPHTDLLTAKLILIDGAIYQRYFYSYDKHRLLTQSIVDNGTATSSDDLTGVTERKVTTYTNQDTAPVGLPIEVIESYYDVPTQCLIMLSRKVNQYSPIGRLKKQEVYDSTNTLRYALTWKYDVHGNVKEETNAMKEVIQRKYDDNDNLIWECGPNQKRHTTYQYDFSNRLTMTHTVGNDRLACTQTHKYDLCSNRIETTDTFGNSTQYNYDEFNRLFKTTYPAMQTMQGVIAPTATTKYNELDHPIQQTDSLENTITLTSNIYGKPLLITYPDGTSEVNTYNLDGTLATAQARNGTVTQYVTDCLGRVVKKSIVDPQTQETISEESFEYNAFHLTAHTDPEGKRTTYKYDGAGRLITLCQGSSKTTYAYDSLGQIGEVREYYDAEQYRLTARKYDLLNRVTEEDVNEGTTGTLLRHTKWSYDADGNVIALEQGNGKLETVYNSLGKPIKVIDPEGNVTHYTYNYQVINSLGQTVLEETITDALGTQTVTTHDAHGRIALIVKKDPFGQILSKKELLYNQIGDLTLATDTIYTPGEKERQIQSYWEYDFEHKLECTIEALGDANQKTTRIKYNPQGQKSLLCKPDGVCIHHIYDAKGRLATIKASDNSFSYKYSYDRCDHLIGIEDLIQNSMTIRNYDSAGRLKQETLGNGLSIAYQHDHFGRPISTTLPDRTQVAYCYNALYLKKVDRQGYTHFYTDYNLTGQLTRSQLPEKCGIATYSYNKNAQLLSSKTNHYAQELTYDPVGNLKAVQTQAATSQKANYTYDGLYQLTGETGWATHTYQYDSLHNCISKDGAARKINALNQLLSAGTTTYQYDFNGNRTQDSTGTTYQYDAFDRLTAIIKAQEKWVYTYDAFHRRLTSQKWIKTQNKWQPEPKELYLYQGENEVGAYTAEGRVKQFRVLGVGKGAEIGAAIAIELNNIPYIPTHDHNGNVVALQNLAGKLVERYQYSAFGEEKILAPDGALLQESQYGNPWRFSSKRTDPTGLVYFGRRYYEPHLGRWLTPDPLGYDAGPNLYAYVKNSPLTHFDLYGLLDEVNDGGGMWSSIRDCAWDIWDNVITFPGKMIREVGAHLPVPLVRNVVSFCGTILSGKNPLHDTSWLDTASFNSSHGYQQVLASHVYYTSGNGMDNTTASAFEMCHTGSNLLGGQFCTHTYVSPTLGVVEYLLLRLGFITPAVRMQTEAWRSIFKECPQAIILHEAHSLDGLVTARALEGLTPEQRARMEIATYGTAEVIDGDKYGLMAARNYISVNDWISMGADLCGVLKGWAKGDGTVQFLESKGWPIVDHAIGGKTYMDTRKVVIDDWHSRYKK